MPTIYWIKEELSKHYTNLDLNKGVDLDRDGQIEESERTDLDNNNEVDSKEWKQFLSKNEETLKSLGGFFKYYYKYGSLFSPDNRIHNLFFIESELASEEKIANAYIQVAIVWIIVLKYLSKHKDLTIEQKLQLIYEAQLASGIGFKAQKEPLFTQNISKEELDCDTSSFFTKFVAHEIGITVYLADAPKHVYIKAENEAGKIFNMDIGEIYSDEYYIKNLHISNKAIAQKVYLQSLSYDEELALFYENRGSAKIKLKKYKEALEDYNKALKLYPHDAASYGNRGVIKIKLKDFEGAIEDFKKSLELDPDSKLIRNNLRLAKIADYFNYIWKDIILGEPVMDLDDVNF